MFFIKIVKNLKEDLKGLHKYTLNGPKTLKKRKYYMFFYKFGFLKCFIFLGLTELKASVC